MHDANVAQLLPHWSDMLTNAHRQQVLTRAGAREKWSQNTMEGGQCNPGPHNPAHTSTCLHTDKLHGNSEALSTAQAACTCERRVYCQSQPKPAHPPPAFTTITRRLWFLQPPNQEPCDFHVTLTKLLLWRLPIVLGGSRPKP